MAALLPVVREEGGVMAKKVAKKKNTDSRPLKKQFAVILTRIHSEHDTLDAANATLKKLKLTEDEWGVVLNDMSKEKKR